MTRIIIEYSIHLIIVFPILLITLRDKNFETVKVLLVFIAFFLSHNILLRLPIEYIELRIIQGNWNWSGKVFSIFGSILFLLLYRKFQLKDYFLSLKQNESFLKKGVLVVATMLCITSTSTYLYNSSLGLSIETILFQVSMPGIDEEISYRGIMLGLLTKMLKPSFKIVFLHPAILTTSILFGLAHGLSLSNLYELDFNFSYFFQTLIMGIIWGWITMKSGSILLALISHNIGNTANKLILMR